jgi:hypothetical protein
MLAAEGFKLPFPLEDVPARLQDITVIEREGQVGAVGGWVGGGCLALPALHCQETHPADSAHSFTYRCT